jgi:hypothetical protein
LSASLAGVAGVFFGGVRGQVGPGDFEMLQSAVLLLLVTISGINSVTGALAGGLTFGLLPKVQQSFKSIRNLIYVAPGLGALGVVRNPFGWTTEFAPLGARIRRLYARRDGQEDAVAAPSPDPEPEAEEVSDPVAVAG